MKKDSPADQEMPVRHDSYNELSNELEAERRLSYSMACLISDVYQALEIGKNNTHTLDAIKVMIQKWSNTKPPKPYEKSPN
jgi:hypothetical protein